MDPKFRLVVFQTTTVVILTFQKKNFNWIRQKHADLLLLSITMNANIFQKIKFILITQNYCL